MKIAQFITPLLFGTVFIIFGTYHFLGTSDLIRAVPFPPERFWVYFTGVGMYLAGISLILAQFFPALKKIAGIGQLCLVLMLLIFVATMHAPDIFYEKTFEKGLTQSLKDLALAAEALLIGSQLLGWSKSH